MPVVPQAFCLKSHKLSVLICALLLSTSAASLAHSGHGQEFQDSAQQAAEEIQVDAATA